MKALEEKILAEGIVSQGNVLKVSSFLNHQIDVPFMQQVGQEFYRLFKDERVDKILTIEASGIGVACLTAVCFDVPVVFAKKSKSKNLTNDCYTAQIASFTHGTTHEVIVEKRFIQPGERILVVDDSWPSATRWPASSSSLKTPEPKSSAPELSLKRRGRKAADASGTAASAWSPWPAFRK